jgi:hypothetical protein
MSDLTTTTPPRAGRRELVYSLPIERVRTSHAALRSPIGRRHDDALAELPLRAVAAEDGYVELVDGFRRLERWRALGYHEVPVVLERARSVEETYALLLAANTPRRTVTAMDEARVVVALLERPGVGKSTAARILGRKPWWVERRLAFANDLAPQVQRRIDAGELRPMVADALTRVRGREQERVVRAIEAHALTSREALALIEAYRSAESEQERVALLRDPDAWVGRRSKRAEQADGAVAARLQERLDRARRVLADLADFALPGEGLTDGERRRLEAAWRAVLHQLRETSATLGVEGVGASQTREEAAHDGEEEAQREATPGGTEPCADHGGAAGGDPAPRDRGALGHAPDREEPGPLPEPGAHDRREGAGSGHEEDHEPERVAPGPLSPLDRRAGSEGDHDDANPPRDPGGGLRGQSDDPLGARSIDPPEANGQA